jgi:hypothetical protein
VIPRPLLRLALAALRPRGVESASPPALAAVVTLPLAPAAPHRPPRGVESASPPALAAVVTLPRPLLHALAAPHRPRLLA